MTNTPAYDDSKILSTLWQIHQSANRADDRAPNLTDIACLIGNHFFCDVCSVYRMDHEQGEIVLAATVGLRQDCVGKLRLPVGEGLCGHVVATNKPLIVERDAMQHPQFHYFPEAGEEPYQSFLGVPIASRDGIEGVLVVQTTEPREFSERETQMLILSADQIANCLARIPQRAEVANG